MDIWTIADIATIATAWSALWSALWNASEEQKNWFIQYVLVKFFWKYYKDYLIQNIVIKKWAELEADILLKKQILDIDSNPSPIMQAIHSEAELEYRNMFWVIEKAQHKINIDNEWSIDEDKLKRIKDISKEFSSNEMQEYISGILAWEYNKSWSYSLKTMDVIKNLTKDDLNLFSKFCWLVIDWEFIFWNFFHLETENHLILHQKWLLYNDYLYLQELWLILWSNTFQKIWDNSWEVYDYNFIICNKWINFRLKNEIVLKNQSYLTNAGKELFNLIEPIFDEELFEMCKIELIRQWFEEI